MNNQHQTNALKSNLRPYLTRLLWVGLAALIAGLAGWPVGSVQAQTVGKTAGVATRFISESGASLEELSAGAVGQGVILYYLSEKGWERPALIVRLHKTRDDQGATAEVYQAVHNLSYIPYKLEDGKVSLDPLSATPSIVIKSLDGWWVRAGRTSYNLSIEISGPMYANWGSGYNPQTGFEGAASQIKPRQPYVNIQVRDPQGEGLPKWEWRKLLPAFQGQSYLRTNYAERECNSPLVVDRGPSPLWPYVAYQGDYEQRSGQYHPPIVADWQQGRIIYFSELVTVRRQNCSYSFYSINDLVAGKLNHPDFEVPFAFYDLSGRGQGFPNLIVRTQHYPANDPWTGGLADPNILKPFLKDIQWIRYSWRNAVGDGKFDQKIEVLGTQPYSGVTSIADGQFQIDAPAYTDLPGWVVGQNWPIVTFVDTEGNPYQTTEGIYEWSPYDVGLGYPVGWKPTPDPTAFSAIKVGLRGEYRLQQNLAPRLYFSSLDRRLHLLSAETGLWNLGNGQVVRLHNLTGGPYLDGWTVEPEPPAPAAPDPANADPTNADPTKKAEEELKAPPVPTEALYALGGYLLYSGPQGVELRRLDDYRPALFETAPPHDQASWEELQSRLQPYVSAQPGKADLKGWAAGLGGQVTHLAGGRITAVRALGTDGFRLELDLPGGWDGQGTKLAEYDRLEPGRYVLAYQGGKGFELQPLTPTRLSLSFTPVRLVRLEGASLPVTLTNSGLEDSPPLRLELWATRPGTPGSVVASRQINLVGGQQLTTNLQWSPLRDGPWTLTPRLRYPDGKVVDYPAWQAQVETGKVAQPNLISDLTTGGSTFLLAAISLLLLAAGGLAGVIFGRQWLTSRDETKVQDAD